MSINCGDCFLAGESDEEKLHLRVVVTSPVAGEVIVVSITTRRRNSESLVVLLPGAHPFIQHESVVAYRYSEIRTVESIEAALKNGQAQRREPMPPDALRRIRAGLRDSDHTPNGVRHYFLTVEGEPTEGR